MSIEKEFLRELDDDLKEEVLILQRKLKRTVDEFLGDSDSPPTNKWPSLDTPSTSQGRRKYASAEFTWDGEETGVTLEDLDALDCPICYEPLAPPVYQCIEGHLACDSCCKKITRCPSCTQAIGVARCRAIERVVQSAKISCVNKQHGCSEKVCYSRRLDHEQKECKYAVVPCVNKQHGCPEKLSHSEKFDHEQNKCIYAPVSCPCCHFVGASKRLYPHFANEHPSSVEPITLNFFEQLTVHKDVTQIVLQESVYKALFVLNRFTEPRGSLVTVTCMAPAASDLKFSYELMAGSGNNQICLKKLVELTPKPIVHPPEKNFLLITNDFHSTTPSGVLILSLRIMKLS